MPSRTAGIPGLAIMFALGGSYLIYAGMKNVPFVEGLRSLLRGSLPAGTPSTPTELPDWLNPLAGTDSSSTTGAAPGGGTALGLKIAMYAKQYVGVPYRWGGATPAGWDCSGFVTWVLVHNGVKDLPSTAHTTAAQYLVWSGASTIGRDQCAAGDLCCWAGHIGIALDKDNMINAPSAGIPTRVQKIYAGVTIRRVNGTT